MDILFDIEKLNLRDKHVFEAMSESEKDQFRKTWILLETQKARLQQQMNHSKERRAREQKILADKERKERTRRLIERGAILEKFVSDPEKLTNDEIVALLVKAFNVSIREQENSEGTSV